MATKIRLFKMGAKKRPFYRIVVADERSPRSGKYIEKLGFYNPLTDEVKLDKELTKKWLENGVQLTSTAKNIISREGVLWEAKDGSDSNKPSRKEALENKKKKKEEKLAENLKKGIVEAKEEENDDVIISDDENTEDAE